MPDYYCAITDPEKSTFENFHIVTCQITTARSQDPEINVQSRGIPSLTGHGLQRTHDTLQRHVCGQLLVEQEACVVAVVCVCVCSGSSPETRIDYDNSYKVFTSPMTRIDCDN